MAPLFSALPQARGLYNPADEHDACGVAQVADKVHSFGLADFHWACGAGLRIMVQKKDKLNLRIDYGFGEKSSGLYVILKEAF